MDRPEFYTVKETAELLRISRSTLYNHFNSGEIPSIHIGRRRLIPRQVIEDISEGFLEEKRKIKELYNKYF